jgi:hypothetical protein
MPAWPDGGAGAGAGGGTGGGTGGGAVPSGPGAPGLPLRLLRGFGHFWWDFLVGDTPELFVAVLIIVGITALLAAAVSTVAAWATMPVLVIAALVVSVLRGRRTG